MAQKMERNYRTGFSLTSNRGLAAPLGNSQSQLILPIIAMTETHNIIAALVRVAKKLAGNKNVGHLCIWGQDPVNQSNNKLNHEFFKIQKTAKMTKRTTGIIVAVATVIW
jgi:hypothetical protein